TSSSPYPCHRDHRDLHSFPTRRSSDLRSWSISLSVGIAVVSHTISDKRHRADLTRSPRCADLTPKPPLPPSPPFADGRKAMSERSEEHTSELQSPCNLVCRLLLEKKKK